MAAKKGGQSGPRNSDSYIRCKIAGEALQKLVRPKVWISGLSGFRIRQRIFTSSSRFEVGPLLAGQHH